MSSAHGFTDKNITNPLAQSSLSVNGQSQTMAPVMSTQPTLVTTNPTTARIPSAIIQGRTPVLGEGGVLVQGPGGLVSANGAYIQNQVPTQFGHGGNIAVANGEEGNSNLMWLLDFKLDFFNDSEAGRSNFGLISILILLPFK